MDEIKLGDSSLTFYWNEIEENIEQFNKLLGTNFTALSSRSTIEDEVSSILYTKMANEHMSIEELHNYINENFNPFVSAA